MKTDKLHWVFRCRKGKISPILGNERNEPLSFPVLKGLTKEECELLTELGIGFELDKDNNLLTHCSSRPTHRQVVIDAPVFIEIIRDKSLLYRYIGRYTAKWVNPRSIQYVNEIVQEVIPKNKIYHFGCYVDMYKY